MSFDNDDDAAAAVVGPFESETKVLLTVSAFGAIVCRIDDFGIMSSKLTGC